jgi:hypothetical protein
MRLTLKTVKPEDLVLLVIRPTKHMDTDTLIVLETAVLDAKPEPTGRNVHRLGWVSIVAWWLHHVSLAGVAPSWSWCPMWIGYALLRLFIPLLL